MIHSTRGNGLKLKHSEHQETIFLSETDQALASAAQGGCRVSILQDIQNLSGRGPDQLALGGPAGADRFCDTVHYPGSLQIQFYP